MGSVTDSYDHDRGSTVDEVQGQKKAVSSENSSDHGSFCCSPSGRCIGEIAKVIKLEEIAQ